MINNIGSAMNIVMTSEDGEEYSGSGYITSFVTEARHIDVTSIEDTFCRFLSGTTTHRMEIVLNDLTFKTNLDSDSVETESEQIAPAERLLRKLKP